MVKRIYFFIVALMFITWQSTLLAVKAAYVTLVNGEPAYFTYQAPDGSVEVHHYEDGIKVV